MEVGLARQSRSFVDSALHVGAVWRLEGARCTSHDPELFFPEEAREGDRTGAIKLAKAVCGGCDVRTACLEVALSLDLDNGIWGGATAPERHRISVERAYVQFQRSRELDAAAP